MIAGRKSERMRERFLKFLFPHNSTEWLSFLRVGLALIAVAYSFSTRGRWTDLVGGQSFGLLGRDMSEIWSADDSRLIPRISWLIGAGHVLGLSEPFILRLSWSCLLVASLFLLVGLACRPAAIAAWFFHLCAAKSGGLLSYGVDNFMTIGLFYLTLSPFPDRWSLDYKISGKAMASPERLGFHRRMLQLTLCLVYFFGGLSKCIGLGWWSGESIWRALTQPPFEILSPDLVFYFRGLLPATGVLVCLLETAYPVFIWGRTRRAWLIAICGMHLLIGLTMGMWLFGAVLVVLNLAAFGPSSRGEGRNGMLQPGLAPGRINALKRV